MAKLNVNAYSLKYDSNTKLSTNFTVREFACQDGSDAIFVSPDLVALLQKVRTYFGKPVSITSAFRTASHNKAVGGATNSVHMYGGAADIVVSGVTPKNVAAYVETLMPTKGGIGIYTSKGFTHVDVRSAKARW